MHRARRHPDHADRRTLGTRVGDVAGNRLPLRIPDRRDTVRATVAAGLSESDDSDLLAYLLLCVLSEAATVWDSPMSLRQRGSAWRRR
jgi:hypothetical protein